MPAKTQFDQERGEVSDPGFPHRSRVEQLHTARDNGSWRQNCATIHHDTLRNAAADKSKSLPCTANLPAVPIIKASLKFRTTTAMPG